jgi:biopolymer transport protein ExbB/TolQ
MDNHTLLTVFVALTGVAVLLQACVLLAILVAVRKTAKAVHESTQDFKATVVPMVHSTRELLERISPQIVVVSSGVAQLTELLNREANSVKISASDIAARVNKQAQRLDAMLTTGLDVLDRAGTVLESAVAMPVRQANGIFAAVRAVIDTYRSVHPHSEPRRRNGASSADNFEI